MTDSSSHTPTTDFRTRSQKKQWEQWLKSEQERLANASGDGTTAVEEGVVSIEQLTELRVTTQGGSTVQEQRVSSLPQLEEQEGTSQLPGRAIHHQLVGIQAVQQLFITRRQLNFTPPQESRSLIFDPLKRVLPIQATMQQPAPLLNPKVVAAKFSGKKTQDADSHVGQFETRWSASGFDGLYNDNIKKEHFAATLQSKAMEWFMQYGIAAFADYNNLKERFLSRSGLKRHLKTS